MVSITAPKPGNMNSIVGQVVLGELMIYSLSFSIYKRKVMYTLQIRAVQGKVEC